MTQATLRLFTLACLSISLLGGTLSAFQAENIGRGLVAARVNDTDVYLGWRLLGSDPESAVFNVYRASGDSFAVKINGAPIADSTNFVDRDAPIAQSYTYYVRAIVGGVKQAPSEGFAVPNHAPAQQYFTTPLNIPQAGENYTYSANDASVADLDGDGHYDIVLKWDPSNSKDNSQSGVTGNVILDGYKFDGTHLWRIDLGRNIRAGAHYTQFMVYDLDGDGIAEVACKTADGTIDGDGNVIGDPDADYRNADGYILTGPEYLTIFDGATGAALATTDYVPARGTVSNWGDNYGNRVDRFLAAVAYLDGERPSLVMCRGYYTRTALIAWDWRDGVLTQRWNFDTGHTGLEMAPYRGQGAHSLTVGDVDGDGFDEIVYGAATIDHDGEPLYSTRAGHGDALHLSDMDPSRPGLETWMAHESPAAFGDNGSALRNAATGELIYGVSGENSDVGRGVAANIDPRYAGFETWASRGGLHNVSGELISSARPNSMNFLAYWDGDLLRELLDGTTISKWDWEFGNQVPLLLPAGVSSNNGTKANPVLSADLFGDWREEVIWRESDSSQLRVYTTTVPTSHRLPTLMHDRQYRLAIAWQNVGYNQPPHPSYYIGPDMPPAPRPELSLVGDGVSPDLIPVEERFPNWLAGRGLPADSDPGSDPEGDGYSLFAEYVFDLSGESGLAAQPIAAQADANGRVAFEIATPRDEFDYVVQRSDDLENWSAHFTILGNHPRVIFHPSPEHRDSFFRLVVTEQEDYNALPQVQIASPEAGASVNEDDETTFEAAATDADGSIASVEFTEVDGGSEGGAATLQFRFALGAEESRTGTLTVNGASQSISFPTSGGWSTWLVHEVEVVLESGPNNTITLASTGDDLANIDELAVAP